MAACARLPRFHRAGPSTSLDKNCVQLSYQFIGPDDTTAAWNCKVGLQLD
jgi:hypothetical protein